VLLVEDDPDHAELVRRGLEAHEPPVEVTVIGDGEAALAYLLALEPRALPHLVLLDLRLPRMSGLELLREVRSRPVVCDLPCVVLTTSAAERDVVRAHELRADSYLVKPGDRDSFARVVRDVEPHWLEGGRSRRGPD
jgi:DNA-binding response OmpR family regulator